jgi:glucose/arabinose dehydrogenase
MLRSSYLRMAIPALLAGAVLAACQTSMSRGPEASPASSVGPKPALPAPAKKKLIPTVQVAEARGGQADARPVAAAGLSVSALATGLRNSNGLAWEPATGALWTVVNERDELGNDLVPEYLTSVRDGGFYGWPYSYFGQHGSWNRKPAAPILTGFVSSKGEALGRPVGVAIAKDGALLVADDVGNTIWRVTAR